MLEASGKYKTERPSGEASGPVAAPSDCAPYSTLVIGLGNPILGDDGLGWRIVECVEDEFAGSGVEFAYLTAGGLELMESMIGYSRVIIVDALHKQADFGQVYYGLLNEIAESRLGHTISSHDTSLATAIELGRTMGAQLPDEVEFLAVSAQIDFTFTEQLSQPVAAALPEAVKVLSSLLEKIKV